MTKKNVIMESAQYNCVIIECENDTYIPFRILGCDAEQGEFCIYEQDEMCPQRTCWLGEREYTRLLIEWDGDVELTARAVRIQQKAPLRIHEYVIVSEGLLNKPFFVSDKTTDLILIASLRCDEKGELYLLDEDLFVRCLAYIRANLPQRNIRLWDCLGIGQADGCFATKEVRQTLIQGVLAHLEKYSLDGLDIDWEYPGTNDAWNEFSDLLVELKAALAPADRLLSCALAPWGCYFTDEAVRALDCVNGMIYDLFDAQGCHQSFRCYSNAIEFFRKKGYPDEAICAGIGFYGRPADKSAVWKGYSYFYKKYGDDLDPNCNLLEGVWFNGRTMCMDKTALALMEGIGGIMIWHHNTDIDFDNPMSLLRGCCEVMDSVK